MTYMTAPAYNGMNQPLTPDPNTIQMMPGLLEQLQASGIDMNQVFGQPQMVGQGTQGQGFAGVGATLGQMADNRRIAHQNDALAKQMGFPDYATYQAYHQKQIERTRGPAAAGGTGGTGGVRGAAQQGFDAAKMLHPSYLLDWVNSRLSGALNK